MCDLCDKNKVYKVLGVEDIEFAANMVRFRVMGKPYCVNEVACCQGCIKDLEKLRDALGNIAERGDRVLPINETLWPTPSRTVATCKPDMETPPPGWLAGWLARPRKTANM